MPPGPSRRLRDRPGEPLKKRRIVLRPGGCPLVDLHASGQDVVAARHRIRLAGDGVGMPVPSRHLMCRLGRRREQDLLRGDRPGRGGRMRRRRVRGPRDSTNATRTTAAAAAATLSPTPAKLICARGVAEPSGRAGVVPVPPGRPRRTVILRRAVIQSCSTHPLSDLLLELPERRAQLPPGPVQPGTTVP